MRAILSMSPDGDIFIHEVESDTRFSEDNPLLELPGKVIAELGLYDESKPDFDYEVDHIRLMNLLIWKLQVENLKLVTERSSMVEMIGKLCEPGPGIPHDPADFVFEMKQIKNLQVTPKFSQPQVPLDPRFWDKIQKCEEPLYHDEMGAHSFTSVNPNDGDILLAKMWDYAYLGAESIASGIGPDTVISASVEWEAARRVAAAMAVLAFGKEFLLK